ncbi:hypothetical protein [Pseudomonas gingeri]|uniref:Uncharacterized protein n=1 Tax=Pseudomonas gingeri TaxID=117681 RepID=A0A7Y8CN23_9PSED|nr:hypothetical protein [Pseudomonas gingeri]NWB32042.1 hypothetical protein [Pseudomonas gingeri]NWC37308.1 hypothetical protein [Pseudomonas gingeri]NWD52914.1 hypothetical protein [Pseudomonas gingeri]
MMDWSEFVHVLGAVESAENIQMLAQDIGEAPVVSNTPGEHAPSFKTSFYRFFKAGVELGFRGGLLKHIHFFAQAHEGYSAYSGDIIGRAAVAWNKNEVGSALGPAQQSGGDKQDSLIGYIRPWCKYSYEEYAVRFEFSQSQKIWKVTLMSI